MAAIFDYCRLSLSLSLSLSLLFFHCYYPPTPADGRGSAPEKNGRKTDRQTDGQTDRQTDGQTARQPDSQAARHQGPAVWVWRFDGLKAGRVLKKANGQRQREEERQRQTETERQTDREKKMERQIER